MAKEVDILPNFEITVISVSNLVNKDYRNIFHSQDRVVYGQGDVKISNTRAAVLKRRRDESGLWFVLIIKPVINQNADTMLID